MNHEHTAYQNGLWVVENLNILAKLEANQKPYIYTHNNGRKYFDISPGKNTVIDLHTPIDYSEAPRTLFGAAKHMALLAINEFADRVSIPGISHLTQTVSRVCLNNLTSSKASFIDSYDHLDSLYQTTLKMMEVTEIFYSQKYKELLEKMQIAWNEVIKSSISNEVTDSTGLTAMLETYSKNSNRKAMIATLIYDICKKPDCTLLKLLDNKIEKVSKELKKTSTYDSKIHISLPTIPKPVIEKIPDIFFEVLENLTDDLIPEVDPVPLPYANRFMSPEEEAFHINASVICDGFAIASLHPKNLNECDFFKMLWYSNARIILDLSLLEETKFLDQEIMIEGKGFLKTKYTRQDSEFKIELTLNEETRLLSAYCLTKDTTALFDAQEFLDLTKKITNSKIDLNKHPLVVYSKGGECRSAIFLAVLRAKELYNQCKDEYKAFRQAIEEILSRQTGRAFQINKDNAAEAYQLLTKHLQT